MKQLTKNLLKFRLTGVEWSKVSSIQFAFSQNIGDAPLKTAEYPGDNTVYISENMVGVIWEKAETALFESGKPFYADTRIYINDSVYNPETKIIKLKMDATLFES